MKTSSFKKFSRVIQQIHTLKRRLYPEKTLEQQEPIPSNPYRHFSKITSELKSLKKQVIGKRIRETQNLIAKNRSRFQISTFELMEHNFRENTHSNILQYLFDYGMNGSIGSELLVRFIKQMDAENGDDFVRLIKKKKYTVEREVSANSGRMDIFICDTENKFVIVIENKIYAGVGERESIEDNDTPDNQLKVYERYVEKNYKSYKKLYVLLSHTFIEENHKPFIFIDYSRLYSAMQSYPTNDVIVKQYEILLHSLINDLSDKRDIIIEMNSLGSIHNVRLNTLEQIKRVLYERN
jgi:hypothetical protein